MRQTQPVLGRLDVIVGVVQQLKYICVQRESGRLNGLRCLIALQLKEFPNMNDPTTDGQDSGSHPYLITLFMFLLRGLRMMGDRRGEGCRPTFSGCGFPRFDYEIITSEEAGNRMTLGRRQCFIALQEWDDNKPR